MAMGPAATDTRRGHDSVVNSYVDIPCPTDERTEKEHMDPSSGTLDNIGGLFCINCINSRHLYCQIISTSSV